MIVIKTMISDASIGHEVLSPLRIFSKTQNDFRDEVELNSDER